MVQRVLVWHRKTTKALMDPIEIQFDMEKAELDAIKKSWMDAMLKANLKVIGLNENAPPALIAFAFGLIESSDIAKNKTARKLASQIQQIDPVENPEKLFNPLNALTLREIVSAPGQLSTDDKELAPLLTKLLAIHKRGQISQIEAASKRISKSGRLLMLNWLIGKYDGKPDVAHSLAFFSDRAMAKRLYWLDKKQLLPANLLTKEPERIRKVYSSLGLRPAKRRVVKDIEYNARTRTFRSVINKTLTRKGR